MLPRLHLSMGALALASGKLRKRNRIWKRHRFEPAEPSGYVFLVGYCEEYTKAAEAFQALPAGAEKQGIAKSYRAMDKVIDLMRAR